MANELISQQDVILAENEKDHYSKPERKGIKQSLIDRLALSEKRIR